MAILLVKRSPNLFSGQGLDLEPDNVHVQKLLQAVESSASLEKEVIEDRLQSIVSITLW